MGSWDFDLTNQQPAIFCNSWWNKNSVYGDISRELLLAWKGPDVCEDLPKDLENSPEASFPASGDFLSATSCLQMQCRFAIFVQDSSPFLMLLMGWILWWILLVFWAVNLWNCMDPRTDKDTQEHWSFQQLIPCFYPPFYWLFTVFVNMR